MGIKYNPDVNNFRELVEASTKRYGDKVAYKYKEDITAKPVKYVEKTYTQAGKDIKSLGTALLNADFKCSKIAVMSDNRYEWVITYLATTTSGKVIAPMDKMLPDNEITSLVERSGVEAAIVDKKHIEIFKKLKESNENNLETIICMDDIEDSEAIKLSDLLEKGNTLIESGDTKYDEVKIDNNVMSVMLFTSGTTSNSKIVMLSQSNVVASISKYQRHFMMYPTDTVLSFLPIHHTFECNITILYGFFSGATIAFCDGLRYIADNMKEYEVSILVAVPLLLETMYKKIIKGIEDQGKTKLINKMVKISNGLRKCHIDVRRKLFKQIIDKFGGKLRMVLYGAASLDKDTIIGYDNLGINSIQGYGLTETSSVLTAEREDLHRPGSAGLPLENMYAKIKEPDKDGIGEVLVKGPNVFLGYYNDEKKTQEAFEDGWFKTGDFGYIDKDGFLYIVGRKNDIIVLKNGKNVYPDELETLVTKLPYVAECMVFERDKDETDTALVAKIVYDESSIASHFKDAKKEEYKDLVWNDVKEINKTLPTYKHIKEIIVTDEPMSKTTTQKVKRYEEIKKHKKD